MNSPSIALPPVDMPVPLHEQTQITITMAVLCLITVAVTIWLSPRQTRMVNLMVIVAGAAGVLLEPIADTLLHIWHPVIGQWTAITTFGHSVPVWVPLAFGFNFGGQGVLMLTAMRRRARPRVIWLLCLGFAITDLMTELPGLFQHMFIYYGTQPLTWYPWMPQPLYLPVANTLITIGAAAGAYMGERFLAARRRPWVVPPLSLCCMMSGLLWYGWPVAITLNGDFSTGVRWASGFVSIGVSLLGIWLLTKILHPPPAI